MQFSSYLDRILAHDPDHISCKKRRATPSLPNDGSSDTPEGQETQNTTSTSASSSEPSSTTPLAAISEINSNTDFNGSSSIHSSTKMEVEGQETSDKNSTSSNAAQSQYGESSTSQNGKSGDIKDNGKNQARKKASQEPIDNFYLAVQNVKRVLPDLEADISPLPPYVQKLHMGPFLWIAPGEHYEYTHFDPDDGMLFVVSGEKRVKLYHFDYLEHMYPNPLGSKGRTIQSTVDVEASPKNLQHQPLFSQVTCDVGTLHAGDCLFIPAFYWHQVSSDPRTVSINTFYGEGGDVTFGRKIVASRFKNLAYWVLNIIEQNRGLDSFAQVAANLKPALTEFFFKQWHERLSDDDLDRLEQVILAHLGYAPGQRPIYDGPVKKHVQLKIRGLRWRD